jgi:hypothetical protein
MQQAQMRRFVITMIYCLSMSALVATAGTFPLTDGTKIVGSIDSVADKGVVFTLDSGETSSRIEWDKFTPEALKELSAEVKTDIDRARLKPLMESIPHEVAKAKEIVIKPLQRPDRPKHGSGIFAMFGSPLGWLIMLVLYGANLFAAYEVCIYRHQPAGTVCGLAAIPFFGVLSPIIYGAMPTRYPPPEAPAPAAPIEEAAAVASEAAPVAGAPAPSSQSKALRTPSSGASPAPAAAPAPALPEPIIFPRGEFSFNRRFFETNSRDFSASFRPRQIRTWFW